MFGSDDIDQYEPEMVVLKSIPETKTYRHVGVDYQGRSFGWIVPGSQDPYSEPYLAILETEQCEKH